MEALRKLERVQSMLAFIDSHGLSSGLDLHSDRFLAHLLLFLVQPCGMLSVEKKYSLALDFLNKVTPEVIKELKCLEEDEMDQGEVDVQPDPPKAKNHGEIELEGQKCLGMPLICLDPMQRANSTLEDFLDSWNEKNLCKGTETLLWLKVHLITFPISSSNAFMGPGNYDIHLIDNIEEKIVKKTLPKFFGSDPFSALINLLQDQGLMTDRIKDELMSGIQYWALETKLCQAVIRKEKILIEDVLQAIRLKSFDYKVLNLLLYQLRGQEVNELHMEFLSVSEFLVEISDDLYDYEDDVVNNTFNILRMFVAVYGASLAPRMLIKCITDAEKKYDASSRKLDPSLSLNYWRRCEEATKEGGLNNSGHAYGKWSIPPLILDEDAFRAQNN